ncbi:thioesterase family protein [Globicatella sanguinis]|uniref:thioesterase family protein n=1 Tax=Globicatella sanguinis TaxID=13076 RepID=UPI000826CF5C|nr:thioesterase family protein [Globicatella sanguinis]
MTLERHYSVHEEHSAHNMGSGGMNVLSTPMLVAYLENTSYLYCQQLLSEGITTVGSQINVDHLAPTLIGDEVRIKITTVKQMNRRFEFELEAFDSKKQIARATHTRVIVDETKFMERL